MQRTLFVPSATKMNPDRSGHSAEHGLVCGVAAQVSFTRILEGDIAKDTGLSIGCAWGDCDNDGYPDLVVADAWRGAQPALP